MELSWSTFVLEIINFLVLMWLLKHFFYKPVLDVISRRRTEINARIDNANARQSEAEQLQQQYESRLASWEQERQQARETLTREIDAERARQLAEVQRSVQQAEEKARVGEERRQADARQALEEQALAVGARFASRLLQQAAGPDVEARLVDLLIAELTTAEARPDSAVKALAAHLAGHQAGHQADHQISHVTVSSAYPLAPEQRQRLETALQTLIAPGATMTYTQDPDLLAGLHVVIDAWVLSVNLRDELQGFVELAHGD